MEKKIDRKIPIGVGIPQSLLDRIDRMRIERMRNRSEFIVELIERALSTLEHGQR